MEHAVFFPDQTYGRGLGVILRRCDVCGAKNPDRESFCSKCGVELGPVPNPMPSRMRRSTRIVLILLLAAVLVSITLILASGVLIPMMATGPDDRFDNGLGRMDLLAPSDGEDVPVGEQELSWSQNIYAVGYMLQISSSPSMDGPIVDTTMTGTSYRFAAGEGTYHWWVRAVASNGSMSASPVWSFSIVSSLPRPVVLGTDGETLILQNGGTTLRWSPVASTSYYSVQISEDPGFSTLLVDMLAYDAYHTTYALQDQHTYFLRVRAFSSMQEGPWSSTYNFNVVVSAGVPSIIGPSLGKTVLGQNITFSWTTVGVATSYHLQLDDAADFSSPLADVILTTSSYSAGTLLNEDRTYFWRVSAVGPGGESDWSQVANFFKGFENFLKNYEWSYDGHAFGFDLNISGASYYQQKDLNEPSGRSQVDYGGRVDPYDPFVKSVAAVIKKEANTMGYGAEDRLNMALAFVQSISYGLDLDTTGHEEYVQYPVEMLVNGVGDCDCKSVLFLSIVQTTELGYDGVLLQFEGAPGHMAVGVSGAFSGTYYASSAINYYYCETTSTGWKVGAVPPEISVRWTMAKIIDV
jgi:predicted nucleic acid-binding Zn ribbon protein